jgi:hypothetical protein
VVGVVTFHTAVVQKKHKRIKEKKKNFLDGWDRDVIRELGCYSVRIIAN